jgi:hypothetical protein
LEGTQSQGGCIVVSPNTGRRAPATDDQSNKSVGRYPDGLDTDENCNDFLIQTDASVPTPGSPNQYVRKQ